MEDRSSVPKGWHSRGYLPHLDQPGFTQFVTFRLYDSVPQHLWESVERELSLLSEAEQGRKRAILCNRYSDLGYGECWLRDCRIARIVEDALLFYHPNRYELLAWTIMPNHVHCVMRFQDGVSLPDTLKAIKGFSAREANRMLNRKGAFWARDYFDRYIRNAEHFENVVRYIDRNPLKAGLCAEVGDWPFGSARLGSRADRNVGGPS